MKNRFARLSSQGPAMWTIALGIVLAGGGLATSLPKDHSKPVSSVASFPPPRAAVDAKSIDVPPISLKAIDEQFSSLAARVAPSVVTIRVEGVMPEGNGMSGMRTGGEGSGVIFRPDGYIITNDHVVGGMEKVTVTLKDGREFPGKVLRAPEMDIAVVKIDAKDLQSLPFANSSMVKPGQLAMAIGAPFGLEQSVTIGHVSATKRLNQIRDPRTGADRIYWDVIQTDASINMGNSGGPLINVDGEVIAINSAIQSTTGSSSGIGFSISSNQARMLAETLIEKGKVERSFLGVSLEDLREYRAKELGLPGGASVLQAQSDGPAAMAGVRDGDVIVKIGDIDVLSQVDLRNAMLKYGPGQKVRVEFYRGKDRRTVEATLTKVPEQPVASAPNSRFNPGDMMDDLRRQFGQGDQRQAPTEPDVQPEGRVRLGVQIENASEANQQQFKIPATVKGAVIISVDRGSVADRAGLKTGDLVVKMGSKSVATAQDLRDAIATFKRGDEVSLEYYRYSEDSVRRVAQAEF